MKIKSSIFALAALALIVQTVVPQARIEAAWDKAIATWNAPKPQIAGSTLIINAKHSLGSGVHIGKNYVLTAAHVIALGGPIKVTTDTGKEAKAELLWANTTYDVALLRANVGEFTKASRLSCRDPSVRETVHWVGNPQDTRFVTTTGFVAHKVERDFFGEDTFMVSGPVIPGMSGGPVLDQRENVIGIMVKVMTSDLYRQKQVYPSFTSLGFAVPASTVCTLMGRK